MWLGRYNITIKYMHTIKSYIQQRIIIICFYKKIFKQNIIKMVLFRLISIWIYFYKNGICPRVIFGINFIINYHGISRNKYFSFWQCNWMRHITTVCNYEINFHTIGKTGLAYIFKSQFKINNFTLFGCVFYSKKNIWSYCTLWYISTIYSPVS